MKRCFARQAPSKFSPTCSELAFINSLIFHNPYIHEKIDDKEIKKTTDLLFETIDGQQDGFHFSVIGLTQQLLGQIQQKKLYSSPLPSYEKTDKKRVKLKKVLKYVREHFSDDVTLYNMAEIAELSPNYFSSYFKSVTDKTPIDYLISYRIERAASKLLSTDLPVTQIAYDCGFNDLSYFIKLFKKHTGFSPAKYRETIDKTII